MDTQERHGGRSGLSLDGARKRRYDDRTGLSLEESINDCDLLASNVVVQPVPGFGVDGLADGAEDAEGAEVVVLDVVLAETAEETDGGGCGVELGELVLLDGLPVAGGGGVNWC